jgi:hypothetical protein
VLSPELFDAFRFFHENAGYVVGRRAVCALALARAELRAKDEGLTVRWEDEQEAWDGDCEAPPIIVCAIVQTAEGTMLPASLGMIGLNSWRDTYVRVVEAQLFLEALDAIDTERDRAAFAEASELASRVTYAG